MSKATAIVRYDGSALSDHAMDVADLAPALLGLSEIVKIANRRLNGDRSCVKVLVNVDTEHKCFQFSIEIVQTIMQRLALLVDTDATATATEIARCVGIIGGLDGGGVGLFKAYKWLAKQKTTLNELDIEDQGSDVLLRNIDNRGGTINVCNVNKPAYHVMSEADVIKRAKDVVRPLTKAGYDKLQFEKDGAIVDEITDEDGRAICAMNPESLQVEQGVNKTTSQAKVRVKSPDHPGDSRWSVVHERVILAKVEDAGWLERYQKAEIDVPPGSFLDVLLRTEIMLDSKNSPIDEPKYFITEVLAVIPPDRQGDLFTDSPTE